jgi:hypothetical protein
MPRSSESIAALAAALAKAQAELVNPEKSLVGTIKSATDDATERLFRYAPLSSGLDIVRKTLGQHAIATVQTTAIDQAAGLVNLTTVLAHSSGEWIASDWPVCAISATATPHRMGAALTYARRYALFTLVGIAGEDDLDAPDPAVPTPKAAESEQPTGTGNGRLNGGYHRHAQRPAARRAERAAANPAHPMLGAEASALLRDRLLGELAALGSGEDAAVWAHRCLPEKNTLTAPDAVRVEAGFRATLAALGTGAAEAPPTPSLTDPPLAPAPALNEPQKQRRSTTIDKTALTLPEPRRIRDRDHVRYVARQPCLVCGRQPSDAHHLRFAQGRALGRKVSDEFTVPLCRGHHRAVHRCGDEVAWWRTADLDPTAPARTLWLETHPLPTADPSDGTGADAAVAMAAHPRTALRDRPRRRRGQNHETKPITAARPQ